MAELALNNNHSLNITKTLLQKQQSSGERHKLHTRPMSGLSVDF